MAAPTEPKQADMFQSIGDRVNEVSSAGNNAEEENFTVDEPQIVDNIGISLESVYLGLLLTIYYRLAMHELSRTGSDSSPPYPYTFLPRSRRYVVRVFPLPLP